MSEYSGVLADAVLAFHFSVAVFIVCGSFLIVAGGILKARWVRNLTFRAIHLGLMVFIAGETALGVSCPLTRLEQTLRVDAGQQAYSETFIAHWLAPLLFFDMPSWAFVMLHGAAAVIIAATWILVPPNRLQCSSHAAEGADAAHP